MPEDLLEQIFEQIAQADVTVPPADQVLARGRQRQRRARLRVMAVALTVALAAGLGARQLAGHVTSEQPAVKSTRSVKPKLPPPGSERLILALDGTGRFVMARVGSSAAPVAVPNLSAVDGGPTMLATNPAGGWVVTYSLDPGVEFQPTRLALVTVTGKSEPFGPVFHQSSVTSVAVSPDASRVAVAFVNRSGLSSTIEVLPMPGHRGPGHGGSVRTWSIPQFAARDVLSLSWAPDGRRLSYIAAFPPYLEALDTLDTAAPGWVAPGLDPNNPSSKYGPPAKPCQPDAVAWLDDSDRLYALEDCGDLSTGRGREVMVPVDPNSGRFLGPERVIAHKVGCESPGLAPSSDGSAVLVSYCGLFLDEHGKLSALRPAGLVAAAFAGFTVTFG